jgi:hypothetical protein
MAYPPVYIDNHVNVNNFNDNNNHGRDEDCGGVFKCLLACFSCFFCCVTGVPVCVF